MIERERCHMVFTLKSLSFGLALLVAIPAYAAPGDPRFLQGTVEWPAVLTGEPVVIVRGDDGYVYSADVDGARRQGAEVVHVGGRVVLLVLEGTRPHEVTAIVIGTGDAVSLSRALSQRALPPVPAAATMPAPRVAVAPVAAVAPAVVPAPPASTLPAPAPAATAPTLPAAAVAPPPVPAPSPSVVAATPPPPAPAPAPAVTTPTTVVVTPPTAPVPTSAAATAPAVATTPAAATTPTAAPTPAAAPAPAPPAATLSAPPTPPAVVPAPASPGKATSPPDVRQQWARVDGRVMSVDGALLVLRADNGSLVMVDISQINPNVSSALRRERLVSVYGYPLEQKFEAAGYIELDPSHPEPPRLRRR